MASNTGGRGFVVRVLGRVAVENEGGEVKLQAGQRQLLALLVASGAPGATPGRLADEVWGEQLPKKWQNSIRVAVSRLRKRTGLPIPSVGGAYRLDLTQSEVDVWRLFQVVDDGEEWHPDLEALLVSAEVFPSIELSPLLLQTAGRTANAQQHLIELVAATGVQQPRRLLGRLVTHLPEDASDDQLVHAIAQVHVDSGASAIALGLIERCRRDRRDVFAAEISAELALLEKRILNSSAVIAAEEPSLTARPLPPDLARYLPEHLVGRTTELHGLLDALNSPGQNATVVRARAGAGKTALLAEFANRTGSDTHVVYLTGSEGSQIGLAPLTSTVEGFAEQVEAVNELDLSSAGRMGILATRLASLIASEASNRRILLLIDDAHWLDSPTCDLINFLVRSAHASRIDGLVIAARDERRRSPWTDLEQNLSRVVQVSELSLAPLDVVDISSLVATARPELSLTARHQFANRLHEASAGLPAIAVRILETGLDPAVERNVQTAVFDRLIDSIDDPVAEIAVGGAIIGRSFRISDLGAFLDKPNDALLDAIDVLVRHNLVVETGSFDRFEFSHQLIVDALLRSVSENRRARLHLRACEMTSDIHALSRHQVASGALTDTATKLETVVASAKAHLRDREFWESAAEFRVAIGLDESDLGPEVYVDFARALSVSGARGASLAIRESAYEKSIAQQRWDLLLDAACSGLPEAEVPDGEEDRLAQLEVIPAKHLNSRQRLTQTLTAARLASQLGRPDEARRWAALAVLAAQTDEDLGEAALSERFVRTVDLSPTERLQRMKKATDPLDLPLRLRLRCSQFRAVDYMELGDLHQAAIEYERANSGAIELNDPLRQWHAMVFGSLLHETRGEITLADELADHAQKLGQQYGIAQAEIVRIAQMGFRLDAVGQLGTLADTIDLIPVSDLESMLVGAAKVRILDAAGRHDLAVSQAAELAKQVIKKPSATSHGVVGLVAPVLGRHPSLDLRKQAQEILEPFRGGAMVLGVGVGLLPSVDYLLALLADGSRQGHERALQRCIAACDDSGFLTWSIRHRMDLAKLTGSKQLVDEAQTVADGTDLFTLFERPDLVA